MTNTTLSQTSAELEIRASLAIRPLAPLGTTPTSNYWAIVNVTLPDGSTGQARAALVLQALRCNEHVLVGQGGRVDLWHVSQLA